MVTVASPPPPDADPNGTLWRVFRHPADWATVPPTQLVGTYYDPIAGALELVPLPSDGDSGWLPLGPVTAPDGVEYEPDREHDQLLMRVCGGNWTPLPCFGGRGWEPGRLHSPGGIAVDARGFLYVADSGNHRVQVIRREDGGVVAILGATNAWGAPRAGLDGGAMTEPVDVAVDRCRCHIFVADRAGGRIHVFGPRFQWVRSFEPRPDAGWPAGHQARPVAVAAQDDGTCLVADFGWPRLIRVDAEGKTRGEVRPGDVDLAHFAGLQLVTRFPVEGTAIIGPLDSGRYGVAWHEVVAEANTPAGTSILVETFAGNDAGIDVAGIPWAPRSPVPIVQDGPASDSGQGTTNELPPGAQNHRRLVLSETERWRRAQHGPYRRAQPQLTRYPYPRSDGQMQSGPPSAATLVTLPPTAMAMVRAGDTLTLTAILDRGVAGPPPRQSVTIAKIDAATVELFADGDAAIYAAGTALTLLERDGKPLPGGPRKIFTLAAGEQVDLGAIDGGGNLNVAAVPHRLAAGFQLGDIWRIDGGGHTTDVEISSIGFAGAVWIGPSLVADYSRAVVVLSDASDRLVVADAAGFEHPMPPLEPIALSLLLADKSQKTVVRHVLIADASQATIWLDDGLASDYSDWTSFSPTLPAMDTDRGQYLWIRLTLRGQLQHPGDLESSETPSLLGLRALFPRPSYLRFLPATFSRKDPLYDPSGAPFVERFLTLFEGLMTDVERRLVTMWRLLDIAAAPAPWIDWLATWVDVVFDPSWTIDKKRLLLSEIMTLYHERGTIAGMTRWIEIYTGRAPVIIEAFRMRRPVATVLGQDSLLGCAALGDECCLMASCAPDWDDQYAHRFTVYGYIDDACDRGFTTTALRALIDAIKPAHTLYELELVLPASRIGMQSTVGIDFVLGEDVDRGRGVVGERRQPDGPWNSVIGHNLFLGGAPQPRLPPALVLRDGEPRIDDDFRIE